MEVNGCFGVRGLLVLCVVFIREMACGKKLFVCKVFLAYSAL